MNRRIFLTQLAGLFLLITSLPTHATTAPIGNGMVVSEQIDASKVGADILKQGGNAIDAAVAVGYALAVTNPCCGNLGGGGFMLIHLANGKTTFLNFREKAPLKATKTMFIEKDGTVDNNKLTNSYLAVATPGTVLGLETARKKYGTMSREKLIAPAIKLAKEGYRVNINDARQFKQYAHVFKERPSVAKTFLKPNGEPYQAGDLLKQPQLAKTLQHIAKDGSDVFYKGDIAKAIVKASQADGGILSMKDFATYNVEEYHPIMCTYRDYVLYSSPPPSSGGVTLCEMLNILEPLKLNELGKRSAKSKRYILEAMRYAFIDRNESLGDPNFVNNPVVRLTSKTYARNISDKILTTINAPQAAQTTELKELSDTTHYSVVDKEGNAVAVTYTLNGFFGSKEIAGNTGFFLNDEMDDFAAAPGVANKFGLVQGDNNAIAPGKRPLSSMTPTIVMQNNKLAFVLGSPGGPRIITAVLLAFLNVVDFDMSLQQAVNAPRYHFQAIPDVVSMEPLAFSYWMANALRFYGYQLDQQSTWSAVEAIQIDPKENVIIGANDDVRRTAGGAVST